MQTPTLLWITDPWSTLDHQKDTTLRLMHEAINMGIRTFWTPSDQLLSASTTGYLSVAFISNAEELLHLERLNFQLVPVSTFHQIHDRLDPPVDEHYLKVISSLFDFGVKPEQILNPPDLIRYQSEKIPPEELSHLSPVMIKVHSAVQIPELISRFSGISEIVSKPLNLAQSIGVKKHPTPLNAVQWHELLNSLLVKPGEAILIEEYLPEIEHGEIRLWFAGKKLIAALKKHPLDGDFRVLIDQGSRIEAHVVNEAEKRIAEQIGSILQKKGILFAAVDLIGTKICDFNITSPGLLVQLERVHQQNFARAILNQALQYRAPMDHE